MIRDGAEEQGYDPAVTAATNAASSCSCLLYTSFQLSRLLFAGALGLLHPLPQFIQRHFIAGQQLLHVLHLSLIHI